MTKRMLIAKATGAPSGPGGAERREQVGDHPEQGDAAHPAHDPVAAAHQASAAASSAAPTTSGQSAPKAWCRPGAKYSRQTPVSVA